jgi:RNA polymerase sigma factor (sigma-70 family)
MSTPPSHEMIVRFNRKESGARNWVFHTYYPFVFSIVNRFLPGYPYKNDLVSDVFVKLLEYDRDFESLKILKYYLYTVTKNACLDRLKTLKKQKDKHDEFENYLSTQEPDVFDKMEIRADFQRMMNVAIQSLPGKCREVFILFYFRHLTHAEIAATLGISKKTVSNQKAIACAKLKMKFDQVHHRSSPLLPGILNFSGQIRSVIDRH